MNRRCKFFVSKVHYSFISTHWILSSNSFTRTHFESVESNPKSVRYQSIDAYLLEEHFCQFHPDSIWNDGRLELFWKRSSQQQQQQQQHQQQFLIHWFIMAYVALIILSTNMVKVVQGHKAKVNSNRKCVKQCGLWKRMEGVICNFLYVYA